MNNSKVTRAIIQHVARVLRNDKFKFTSIRRYDPPPEETECIIFLHVVLDSYWFTVLIPKGVKNHTRIVRIKHEYFYLYTKHEDVQIDDTSNIRIADPFRNNSRK